jgi:hypothetical protein
VFCTFEASGAMATCVIESVHMVAAMCIILIGEVVGGVVGVKRGASGPYPRLDSIYPCLVRMQR